MGRELIIRSDEACAIADDLARRLDVSATEIVEAALRKYRASMEPPDVDKQPTAVDPRSAEEKAAFIEEILALGARARAQLGERATSNHDDLYDDDGLPR